MVLIVLLLSHEMSPVKQVSHALALQGLVKCLGNSGTARVPLSRTETTLAVTYNSCLVWPIQTCDEPL